MCVFCLFLLLCFNFRAPKGSPRSQEALPWPRPPETRRTRTRRGAGGVALARALGPQVVLHRLRSDPSAELRSRSGKPKGRSRTPKPDWSKEAVTLGINRNPSVAKKTNGLPRSMFQELRRWRRHPMARGFSLTFYPEQVAHLQIPGNSMPTSAFVFNWDKVNYPPLTREPAHHCTEHDCLVGSLILEVDLPSLLLLILLATTQIPNCRWTFRKRRI